MASSSTVSSFLDTVWFHIRRSVLRCRARRYRRLAIHDEIRVDNDLVIIHQRRDLKFETKVAEFNRKYRRRAPKDAVSLAVNLRKADFDEGETRKPFVLFTLYFFDFKDTLTVQKGSRKVVVDRTGGLAVYGNLKAALQQGGAEDFYRQTVLTLEVPKGDNRPSKKEPEKPKETEAPKESETPKEPEIVLDPEEVAREKERFVDNVGKIEKAIGNAAEGGPVEFEDHERVLVEYLRGCEDCRATRQELQAQLTPFRKRLASVVASVNRKSCDVTGDPLIVQDDNDGDYQMIVSYYNIIFSDGR